MLARLSDISGWKSVIQSIVHHCGTTMTLVNLRKSVEGEWNICVNRAAVKQIESHLINDHNFDILLLSETWFATDTPQSILLDTATSEYSAVHVVSSFLTAHQHIGLQSETVRFLRDAGVSSSVVADVNVSVKQQRDTFEISVISLETVVLRPFRL